MTTGKGLFLEYALIKCKKGREHMVDGIQGEESFTHMFLGLKMLKEKHILRHF